MYQFIPSCHISYSTLSDLFCTLLWRISHLEKFMVAVFKLWFQCSLLPHLQHPGLIQANMELQKMKSLIPPESSLWAIRLIWVGLLTRRGTLFCYTIKSSQCYPIHLDAVVLVDAVDLPVELFQWLFLFLQLGQLRVVFSVEQGTLHLHLHGEIRDTHTTLESR